MKETSKENTRITFRKMFGHLGTVLKHKYWVFHYARKLGIGWRGFVHDMSKFSPTEFWESVRYWNGKSSPIPVCKVDKGYSLAWQHHKGRNTHHYEYWIDRLDEGGVPIKVPFEDMLELIADWLGAGRAYLGKNFTLKGEFLWFVNKVNVENPKIHLTTQKFIGDFLSKFAEDPRNLTYFKKIFTTKTKKLYEES